MRAALDDKIKPVEKIVEKIGRKGKKMENDTRRKIDIAKKIIKIVFKILYHIFMLMCVLLIIIVVFQKISDSNRSIGGYRIFRVVTGSMIPEYDIGEVVISKEMDPSKIEVGDDIVYLGKSGDYNGRIIMHKVVAIDKDESGNLNFHAKGINNSSIEDAEIKADQIYGVVKFKSGILTSLYVLATTIDYAFIIITVLVLNVFISFKFPGKSKIQQLDEELEEEEEDVEYEDDEEEEVEELEEEEDTEE